MPINELPLAKDGFTEHVADAYEHLHDLVYLRTHPLLDILVPASEGGDRKRARDLHTRLSNLIEEINPGSQAVAFSSEWRRHRYMVLRYQRGLTHQEIADQFQVGLRQYYRLRKTIVDEIAALLWDRYVADGPEAPATSTTASEDQPPTPTALELLRLEGGRLAQVERYAHVQQVMAGVLSLLQDHLRQRGIRVELHLPAVTPPAAVSRDLLRQILLSILGYLAGPAHPATLSLSGQVLEGELKLVIAVEVEGDAGPPIYDQIEARIAELQEMAAMGACRVATLRDAGWIRGFELWIPVAHRTVLVVDDNEDVIQLLRGYLTLHGYRVVAAQRAQEALRQARQLRPYAITLDLMMPEHDGWELLQTLVNDPEIGDIPVIVCTVLKQKELALALGATAYLEKPITEHALVSTLQALTES